MTLDSTVRFDTVIFPPRFVGPMTEWANGGVVCGTLAEALGAGPATVRLERPIPIESELQLEHVAGVVELRAAEGQRLAVARSAEPLDLAAIGLPPFTGLDSAAVTVSVVPRDTHPAGGCFVCGPQHPSGLDLQPGPLPDSSCLATTLHVRQDLALGPDGVVTPPVVWAAMDCPGWYAGCGGQMALLGTMTAQQFAPVRCGDDLVVQAWSRKREGRKALVGSALWSSTGSLLAVAEAVWIATPDLTDQGRA